MGKTVYSDQEFIELWKTHESASALAKAVGMDLRNIIRRKNNLEAKYGEPLKSKNSKHQTIKENSVRKQLGIENGIVLVFSDAHFWPQSIQRRIKVFFGQLRSFSPRL